ncbi:MAG: exonuclease SbcCD subunit D [Acutalibacteraceae bacterium]|nr:exonuclease SbcCD subunit D [Acutalibacteraceae bacterium]
MKFIHLSDLHIGKRVNEFSMLEEQEYILTQIINIIDEEAPQAVVIAGDVYDKSVPPAEAVQLFDSFLSKLAKRNIHTFVISGNHDSPERIAFGCNIMNNCGIYMSPVYNGFVQPISLKDNFGTVNFYMLPFIKPANVRRYYPESNINSYTDAVKVAIDNMNIDYNERNVIITHQFVTGAITCDSEEISVGGTDNVDSVVFNNFDYVALGHIHKPQTIGNEKIRYCGTPLKYSFSEAKHQKSVTVVQLREKGDLSIKEINLIPKNDLREIKGTYLELTAKANYINTQTNDYMHITLTDEEDIPDAIGKLRVIYPNLMKLDYDNKRTRSNNVISKENHIESKSPIELLEEFYQIQNNQPLSPQQFDFAIKLMEEIWEEE